VGSALKALRRGSQQAGELPNPWTKTANCFFLLLIEDLGRLGSDMAPPDTPTLLRPISAASNRCRFDSEKISPLLLRCQEYCRALGIEPGSWAPEAVQNCISWKRSAEGFRSPLLSSAVICVRAPRFRSITGFHSLLSNRHYHFTPFVRARRA
jgi:hypothetical protein